MDVAKTKAQISFAVTTKLICVFVFAFAKIRFSHDAAQMMVLRAETRKSLDHFIRFDSIKIQTSSEIKM